MNYNFLLKIINLKYLLQIKLFISEISDKFLLIGIFVNVKMPLSARL